MPKWYVKTFKAEYKINKLISFCVDDEKLIGKYKAISTKIEDLKIYWIRCFISPWKEIYKNQNKNIRW